MEENYTPKNLRDVTDFTEQFDGKFKVGQCYDDKPAQQLRCAICGGTTFHVAQGSYFTAIRCPVCRYERMIHSG